MTIIIYYLLLYQMLYNRSIARTVDYVIYDHSAPTYNNFSIFFLFQCLNIPFLTDTNTYVLSMITLFCYFNSYFRVSRHLHERVVITLCRSVFIAASLLLQK